MRRLFVGVTATVAVALACAAQTGPAPTDSYLAGREPDTVLIVPAAPKPGSARDLADREIFRQTRALAGSPRWRLAQSDAVISLPAALGDFSCAAGVVLDPKSLPALTQLLRRLGPDFTLAYSRPKDLYQRPRPYMRDPGEICVARSKGLDESYDYPSGHATFGWTLGLILAEIVPDRAGPILARARAYGESRAVCGVHSASAVGEARTTAASLVAALHASAAFRSDLEAARAELAALHGPPPEAAACRAEAALTAATPW